jgi:16S rRNA (guanine527-N7)-methyltransferase
MGLSEAEIRELLTPFGLPLTSDQMTTLRAYLELLLRWNSRMNLTSVRDARECVTRHFGESLYLAKFVELEGRLLDVGSGAGFPGLALKIVFPKLQVTLLEPVGKKRAFLKEVARACQMGDLVEVRSERLSEFMKQRTKTGQWRFAAATSRAVGRLEELIPEVSECLEEGAGLYLWLSHVQHDEVLKAGEGWVEWDPPVSLPLSQHREIWRGRRRPKIEFAPCFT